jgi:hypothetical protein
VRVWPAVVPTPIVAAGLLLLLLLLLVFLLLALPVPLMPPLLQPFQVGRKRCPTQLALLRPPLPLIIYLVTAAGAAGACAVVGLRLPPQAARGGRQRGCRSVRGFEAGAEGVVVLLLTLPLLQGPLLLFITAAVLLLLLLLRVLLLLLLCRF